MKYDCSTCIHTSCEGTSQCSDYEYANEKQQKKRKKEIADAIKSSTNIHDYDEEDSKRRELLLKAQKMFYFLKK